jgi:hypothetical protein
MSCEGPKSIYFYFVSVKEKVFFKGSKTKKVKDAMFMVSWMSIRLLEIFTLRLERVFNRQTFMSMICWHFKRIVLM